jgi:hypothetical protein
MKFETCPRCSGNWEKQNLSVSGEKFPYYRCNACDLHYYDNREEISLRRFIKPDYNLVWFYNENCCGYGSLEDAMSGTTLRLPWLPFAISKERFRLLLLFS